MGKVTKNVPSACFSQCQHVDELGKSGEAAVTILPSPVFHLSSDALKTESKRKKARTENQLQLRVPSYHNHK